MNRILRCALIALTACGLGCGSEPDWESVGEVSDESVVCGVGPTVPGIDVSKYQGQPNWVQVAESGVRFAITRTNDGGYIDPEFDRNWPLIRERGLVRGAYQFFRSTKDPVAMADLMLEMMGPLGPGDLAPVIDVEQTNGATPEEMAAEVAVWVEHVEAMTGRTPIVYTGKYFWNGYVKSNAHGGRPLWHAQYTSAECPDIASAWNQWAIWQYTSQGSVPGILGNVDLNRLNGDELALQDLAANGYRASIVSIDHPARLEVGTVGTVELVLRNDGARAWSGNTWLATSNERDRASALVAPGWESPSRVLPIDGEVKPGETVTLRFDILAPAEVGPRIEHFNLVEDGVAWFSDLAPGGGPADDAIALSLTITPPIDPEGIVREPSDFVEGGVPNHAIASASCAMTETPARTSPGALGLLVLTAAWLRRSRRSSKIGPSWPLRPSTRSSACSPATPRRSASLPRSSSRN